MANQKSYKSFKRWSFILSVVSFFLLAKAWSNSGDSLGSEGSVWLCLLFVAPVIIQFLGLWHLDSKFESDHHLLPQPVKDDQTSTGGGSDAAVRAAGTLAPEVDRVTALVAYSRFYLVTMAICLLTYSFLWVVYANAQKYYGWESNAWEKGLDTMTWGWSLTYFFLSLFALFIIGVLLCLVMWMTRAIIGVEGQTSKGREYLKRGAAEAPFLTLIFFLTIFLGVSYLLGFAFAFHDKARSFKDGGKANINEPALVMRNLFGPEPTVSPDSSATSTPSQSPTPIATFMFDEGTSHPNSGTADELAKSVIAIEEKSNSDKGVRVLLIGGADLGQIKSRAYQSNYELAEARALNAKNLILEKLSASKAANVLRNIEWTCLARPKEGKIERLGKGPKGRVDPTAAEGKEDRIVQVSVIEAFEAPTQLLVRNVRANRIEPLRLMDYIYFANYTITTTGYGDIVPHTTYAKFICSFANICEVLFLVVFFNALLSLAGAVKMSAMADQVGELHARYPGAGKPIR